jgi:hypothetical protein
MWWAALLNSLLGTLSSGVAAATSSYESIASATVGTSGVVTFSSIPATYSALQVRFIARTDRSGSNDQIKITLNSDTGTNYTRHYLQGNGASAIAAGTITLANNSMLQIPAASVTASIFGVGIIDIQDYANTTKYTTLRIIYGEDLNSGTTASSIYLQSGLWLNTAAVSTIAFSVLNGPNYVTGTQFALYGIKG